MSDIAGRPIMPQSDFAARRRQARRFWGAMGAVMRETSRWLDDRSNARVDGVILKAPDRSGMSDARNCHGF